LRQEKRLSEEEWAIRGKSSPTSACSTLGCTHKKLLFMGGEIGQWQEWNYDQSIDWHLLQYPLHDGLRMLVQHLNFLYLNEPAFSENDDEKHSLKC
jgi:1,4-alpha-glucan branching enzyme